MLVVLVPFGVGDGPCSVVLLGQGQEDEGLDGFVGVVGVGAGVGDEAFPFSGCAVGVGFFAFGDEAVDGDGGVGAVWDEGEEVALAFFEVGGGGVTRLEVGGFVDAGTDGGVGVGDVPGGVPGVVGDDVGGADGVAVGAVDLAWVGEEVGEPLDACGVEAGAVGGLGSICACGHRCGGC